MMLYHASEVKGSRDGLLALEMAREQIPCLNALIFGVSTSPKLPDWMTYHYRVSQSELRRLYNRSTVLLSPSWSEGWPLVPAEGLMCGCAIAATDIAGHREYLAHEQTALLSESKKPELLANSIVRLLSDSQLRKRLAYLGHQHIQEYTWNRAGEAFEQFLVRLVEA
jgi:glycosyltransferase involved in cell wall biosynthesis